MDSGNGVGTGRKFQELINSSPILLTAVCCLCFYAGEEMGTYLPYWGESWEISTVMNCRIIRVKLSN